MLALVVGASVAPFRSSEAQLRPEAIARKALPAVVRVTTYDANNEALGIGGGFLIDSAGHLITNAHVVKGASRIDVEFFGGKREVNVAALAYDSSADLAVLQVRRRRVPFLHISDELAAPGIGTTIYVVGNPLGLDRTFSDGLLSGWRRKAGHTLMQISAPISHGSSGGPVIDAYGHVIGVATAMLTEGQNLNLAIPAPQMRAILVEALRDEEGLSLPLGQPIAPAVDSTAAKMAEASLDELSNIPQKWFERAAVMRLGAPFDVKRSGNLVSLMYSRVLFGHQGYMSILINESTNATSPSFSYFVPRSLCTTEFDSARAAIALVLGSPTQVNDSKGACDIVTATWDIPLGKRVILMSSPAGWRDGTSRTQIDIHFTYQPN